MKIISCIFLSLMMLPVGGEAMARTMYENRIQFFEKSIPNKDYEDNKHAGKTSSADPDSYFLAKIEILESPLLPKVEGPQQVMVKVIEVLNGRVPAEKFIVHYLVGHLFGEGLPHNHAEGKHYFINGGRIWTRQYPFIVSIASGGDE